MVMKPVEIDDVPVVTFAVTGADSNSFALRRIGEELVERLAVVPKVSRAFLVGGQARTISVELEPDRLLAHKMGISEVKNAVAMSNAASPASTFGRLDKEFQVVVQPHLTSAADVGNLVVGVFDDRPVFLKDLANVSDGPDEVTDYVRHGWGAASEFDKHASTSGWLIGAKHGEHNAPSHSSVDESIPAVTIAISKQKGANAVQVADAVIKEANRLREEILPDDVELIVTRNNGIVANEKVNELIEALGVAIVIVILLLTFGLGWREALIVSIAVPVVFGLTLAVNLLFGYTINRVTLFALILALGLLVDDPIVDVENIARHF